MHIVGVFAALFNLQYVTALPCEITVMVDRRLNNLLHLYMNSHHSTVLSPSGRDYGGTLWPPKSAIRNALSSTKSLFLYVSLLRGK